VLSHTVQVVFLVSAPLSGRSPLGSPAKSARIRRAIPIAAPALCGVAAAIALAGAPAASASVASPSAASATVTRAYVHHPSANVAAGKSATTDVRLLSVATPAATSASAAPEKYTVQSGDTLSAIAQRYYQDSDFWPAIYWANDSQIQYANLIQVGQVLTIPAKPASIPAAPTDLSPAPAPAPVQAPAPATDSETYAPAAQSAPVQSAPVQSAPVQSTPVQSAPVQSAPVEAAPVQSTTVSTTGDSSFQACVISRESGGNSQVMNSSGHYGLYQFSASTWAAYGGNPADFGNASVAEQNQVFDNAMAAGGENNWAPYDGC